MNFLKKWFSKSDAELPKVVEPMFSPIPGVSEDRPINERYKWNKEYIEYLKLNFDIKSTDENDVIEEWLNQTNEAIKVKKDLERREKLRKSPEPWVEVIGEYNDEKDGIGINLDWNPAFIKLLRSHGYNGTESEMIQRWLNSLTNEALLEDDDDDERRSDFE
jgi:hypothetical protein